MEVVYWAVIITCCIASTYYIIKLNDENLFGKKSEINLRIINLTRENIALDKLVNSNIMSIGNANLKIKNLEDQFMCLTGKMDKTTENAERQIDSLQEHCARLREGQIVIKEQLSSKRPILRMTTPIPVTLASPVTDLKLMKKIKNQLKEVSK